MDDVEQNTVQQSSEAAAKGNNTFTDTLSLDDGLILDFDTINTNSVTTITPMDQSAVGEQSDLLVNVIDTPLLSDSSNNLTIFDDGSEADIGLFSGDQNSVNPYAFSSAESGELLSDVFIDEFIDTSII